MTQRADSSSSPELFSRLSELERLTIPDGWSEESFRSEAEKDNGFVLYITENDEITALLTGDDAVGEGDITNVSVHPTHRRKGLACELICEFQRLLPHDTENIFLEVRASNAPAVSLYEKCGFSRISVRKNFYRNPREDAIVMRKEVK